jgi:hypothetical protein
MFIDFVFIVAGLLLLIPLLSLAKAQRKKILAWAVANITEKDAKDALVEASRQGQLFQAEDGRYYPKQETSVLPM